MKHWRLLKDVFAHSVSLVALGVITILSPVTAFSQIATNSFISLPGCDFGSVAWGDYDGDGRLDVLLTGYVSSSGSNITQVWRNTGSGFVNIQAGLPGVSDGDAVWEDYDNDGRLDILVAGWSSSGAIAQVWRNTGQGFSNVNALLPAVDFCSAAWGDYDNDGKLDILISGFLANESYRGITKVLRNTGNGFEDINAGLPDMYNSSVAWGDYDNDGRLDILLSGRNEPNAFTQVWRNTGSGFTNINAGLPGVSFSSVAWGDFDNDGRLDILVAGYTGSNYLTLVWRNTGNGFTNVAASLPGLYRGSVSWGDYDNDGRSDILMNGRTASETVTRVFRNASTGLVDSGLALPGIYYGAATWGDYNNNGRLDILLSGWTGANLLTEIWGTSVSNSNRPPTAPVGLTASVLENSVRLSWSSGTDAETPGTGLSSNLRVGTTPGGTDVVSPMSLPNGSRLVPAMGNCQQRLFAVLTNLPPRLYYWSVQAVDTGFAGSPFAAEQTFLVGGPVLNITPIAGNSVRIVGYGASGATYSLQASTNLVSWVFWTGLTAGSDGIMRYTNSMNTRYRYYRLRQP